MAEINGLYLNVRMEVEIKQYFGKELTEEKKEEERARQKEVEIRQQTDKTLRYIDVWRDVKSEQERQKLYEIEEIRQLFIET